jgi:uncharacterized protein (DUF433 family)
MATIETATQIDLSPYIEHRLFGERPHLRGRRLPVWVVAHAVLDNQGVGVPELVDAYDMTTAEGLATLLYYTQHRDEIEALEAAENEKFIF